MAGAKTHNTRERKNSEVPKGATNEKVSLDGDEHEGVLNCIKCDKPLEGKRCQCDVCNFWFHIDCADVSEGKYQAINEYKMHWYCKQCESASSKLLLSVTCLQSDITNIRKDITACNKKITAIEDDVKNNYVNTTTLTDKLTEIQTSCSADVNQQLKVLRDDLELEKAAQTASIDDLLTKLKAELLAKINDVNGHEGGEEQATGGPGDEEGWQLIGGSRQRRRNIQLQINEAIEEKSRIEKRRLNLIVTNLKESNNDATDLDKLKFLIRDKLHITEDITITDHTRLGARDADKDRMLRFTLQDFKMKKLILSKATTLRNLDQGDDYYMVYIKPDLTPKQTEESKNLVAILKKTRIDNPTKKWKIFRGKIVEIDESGNNVIHRI